MKKYKERERERRTQRQIFKKRDKYKEREF